MNKKDNKVVDSIFWVGIGSLLSRVFSILTTLILAKLLTPNDFGIISIAILFSSTLGLFRDIGLNQSLIYQKKDVHKAADTAMIMSIALSIFLYGVAYLLSAPTAIFFNSPPVEDVIKVLPVTLIISAFSSIPSSLLEKEMDFKKRALPELASFFTYFVVTITTAKLGFSYWSIIIGLISHSFVNLVVTFIVSPWHPTLKFHPEVVYDLLSFGKYAMFSTIVIFIYRNVDDFALGKILGMKLLGFYTLAYRISNMTTTQITNMISKVTYPAFVKISNDIDKVREFYLNTFRWLSIVNIPITIGIISLAPHFFHIFYGNKWNAAIVPTQILALFGLIRGLFFPGGLFMSMGKIKETTYLNTGQLIVFLLLIYPTILKFGIVGLCILMLTLQLVLALIFISRIELFLPNTKNRYIGLLAPPLLISLVTIALPINGWIVVFGKLNLISFLGLIALTGLFYLFVIIKWNKEILDEIKSFIKVLKGQ